VFTTDCLEERTMTDIADVSPHRLAELVAPHIERLTLTVVQQAMARAAGTPVAGTAPPDAMRMLGQLRIALLARPVTPAGLAAVYRYRDDEDIRRDVDGLHAAGLIDVTDDGAIAATARGRAVLTQMYRVTADVVRELWAGHGGLDGASDLTGRVVQAALATGGPAYATMAPPYEPADATVELLLHTRLSALRYHRADAHAAAWQAAGLSRTDITELPAGATRDAIEAETNRRNGMAYTTLSPHERATLLASLTALVG
jgi:hypothetical protein